MSKWRNETGCSERRNESCRDNREEGYLVLPLREEEGKFPKLSLTFAGQWKESVPSAHPNTLLPFWGNAVIPMEPLRLLTLSASRMAPGGVECSREVCLQGQPKFQIHMSPCFFRGDSAQVLARQATDDTTPLPTGKMFPSIRSRSKFDSRMGQKILTKNEGKLEFPCQFSIPWEHGHLWSSAWVLWPLAKSVKAGLWKHNSFDQHWWQTGEGVLPHYIFQQQEVSVWHFLFFQHLCLIVFSLLFHRMQPHWRKYALITSSVFLGLIKEAITQRSASAFERLFKVRMMWATSYVRSMLTL